MSESILINVKYLFKLSIDSIFNISFNLIIQLFNLMQSLFISLRIVRRSQVLNNVKVSNRNFDQLKLK